MTAPKFTADAELDEVLARADRAAECADDLLQLADRDVPDLVGEVRRLRTELGVANGAITAGVRRLQLEVPALKAEREALRAKVSELAGVIVAARAEITRQEMDSDGELSFSALTAIEAHLVGPEYRPAVATDPPGAPQRPPGGPGSASAHSEPSGRPAGSQRPPECLRTPEQWCRVYGMRITGPDGWRDGQHEMGARGHPVGLAEFQRRASVSTVDAPGDVWKRINDDLTPRVRRPEPTP